MVKKVAAPTVQVKDGWKVVTGVALNCSECGERTTFTDTVVWKSAGEVKKRGPVWFKTFALCERCGEKKGIIKI